MLNQLVGATEEAVDREWRKLRNPFAWIKGGLLLVIRLPFMLVAASGFDVAKIEDHVLAKVFKLVEILAIIYLLLRFGADAEFVREMLGRLLGR